MSTGPEPNDSPPALRYQADGNIDNASLADVIEWFLNHDERTARIRHTNSEELFRWKQGDDAAEGVPIYPFENAEARFAIGLAQAVAENNDEAGLQIWITNVLEALGAARETRTEMTTAYGLDQDIEALAVKKAERLPSAAERRIYLTSCWLETLFTAEARVLGWIYQERFGRPFEPATL